MESRSTSRSGWASTRPGCSAMPETPRSTRERTGRFPWSASSPGLGFATARSAASADCARSARIESGRGGSGRDRSSHLQPGLSGIVGKTLQRFEAHVPARGEADDPVEAELVESPEKVDPLVTDRLDVLVAGVDGEAERRRIAADLVAALVGDRDQLRNLVAVD